MGLAIGPSTSINGMLISIDGFDRILTRIGANKNRIDRLFLLSTQSNKSGANVALDMRSGIMSAQIIGFSRFYDNRYWFKSSE